MTPEATNTRKRRMDCGVVSREEIAERYLTGGLSEHDREAFEEHYFDCERCFDKLKILQEIRDELHDTEAGLGANRPQRELPQRAGKTRRSLVWLGVAATVTLAASLGMWLTPSTRDTTREGTPSPVPPPSIARPTPPHTESPAGPVPPSPVSVAELARFDPPVYKASVFRSPEDDARALFLDAMQHYARRDYLGTINGLRAAVARNPRAADARFFLGVSLLLEGETDGGIAELKRTVAIGDSPYLEEGHFYLAKGFLQRGDLTAARATLREMIALAGDHQRDAKLLLSMVERARVGKR